MSADVIWDKENDVAQKWIEFVDDNVLSKLPQGTHVKGIFPHGSSYWTRTAEVQTEQADGSPTSYFLKVMHNGIGKGMASGEFAFMSALYQAIPDLTPTPIA